MIDLRAAPWPFSLGLAAGALSYVSGTFLPALGLVSLPVDTLYGLGFVPLMLWPESELYRLLVSFGGLFWPLAASILIGFGVSKLIARAGSRMAVVSVIGIGLLICGPSVSTQTWRAGAPIWWPSYVKSMFVIY